MKQPLAHKIQSELQLVRSLCGKTRQTEQSLKSVCEHCGRTPIPNTQGSECALAAELERAFRQYDKQVYALSDYDNALWDVQPQQIEKYLEQQGWVQKSKDADSGVWVAQPSRDFVSVRVGYRTEIYRPVDLLKDALQTLEVVEKRTRFEILAELLMQ